MWNAFDGRVFLSAYIGYIIILKQKADMLLKNKYTQGFFRKKTKKEITHKKSAIVWIQSTRNNTVLTLTDFKGSTLAWSSGGCCGFKNSRKATAHAAEMAAISLSEKMHLKGVSRVVVKMKGLGRSKKKIIYNLSRSGILIERVVEVYNIPFNGCRRKRKRRL